MTNACALFVAVLWLGNIAGTTVGAEAQDSDGVPEWIVSLDPKEITEDQLIGILMEEKRQKNRLAKIVEAVASGEKKILSKLPVLQDLGRVLYKLEKYEDALEISQEVAKINADEFGSVDRRTIAAVTNVASTMFRLGRKEECRVIMKEMFPLQLERFGLGSKEVSFHIGV